MEALTIQQAATTLGVTPQRVSQRLRDGSLEGPPPPTGADRRGAPRVWVTSVQTLMAGQPASRGRMQSPEIRSDPDVQALRYDTERLRLALDASRDNLGRQRRQTSNVVALLAEVSSTLQKTVVALQEQLALAEEADRITEGYSSVLTNHFADREAASDL